MPTSVVHCLLVEDDEVDSEAVQRAFAKLKLANAIIVASDGFEALNILRGEGGYARLPRPYLILLDLNLPRMNGIEFLEALRKDSELKSSVVFVLTTSNDPKDIVAAYDEQVAGYFLKRKVGEEFLAMTELIESYWRIVAFPPEQRL
jgi:CheY-like chemotaxis protein